jgi:type II secretory pathway pseudopilin PulG
MKVWKSKAAAYTLVEIMVTLAIVGVTGAGVFEILRAGTILFDKNTAINLSHSQSRFGLLELQQDMNSAVSTPELTDSTGTIISGTATGPAAGVSFQGYAGGPFCLYVPSSTTPIAATATSIQVITGTAFVPLPGETIHIQYLPNTLLEVALSGSGAYSPSTTGTATSYTPSLANQLGSAIALYDPVSGTALHVACFFTTPIVYVVQNKQLLKEYLDPAGSGRMLSTVLAYNVSSTTPFSMPTVNSSPSNTFLEVQNFTTADPSSSQQGYLSVTTPMTLQVTHFAQLTSKY